MENLEQLDYSAEAPNFSQRDNFVRIKPPRFVRHRPRRQRSNSSFLPSGIRQRRNKHWNW